MTHKKVEGMATETVLTNDEIYSLGMSHNVNGPYSFARAIEQAVLQHLITDADCIERAARSLARSFDYPWDFMTNEGRENMREHASAAIAAAMEQQL